MLDDLEIGFGVQRQAFGGESAAVIEGEIQQNLIGQMLVERGVAQAKLDKRLAHLRRHLLCRLAALPKGGKQIDLRAIFNANHDHIARPRRIRDLANLNFAVRPAQHSPQGFAFALGDDVRQPGQQNFRAGGIGFAALMKGKRRRIGDLRMNHGGNFAAADRIKTVLANLQVGIDAETPQQRQKALGEKFKRRGAGIVRAAAHGDSGRLGGAGENRQHRLHHLHRRSGRGNGEEKISGPNRPRKKFKLERLQRIALAASGANFRGGIDTGQMLMAQTGFVSFLADMDEAKGFAGRRAQRQRRAQNLAAAFAHSTVDQNHELHLPRLPTAVGVLLGFPVRIK